MRQVRYRSAGGVVVHGGRVLLLERPSRGEVRLPKGHIEEGETPSEAALREVREEAGYVDLAIVTDLGSQRVQFVDPYRERRVSRNERYFLMRLCDEGHIARDEHERQFVPVWMSLDEALSCLTFEVEREFIRRAVEWMARDGMPDLHQEGNVDERSK